ncbi:vacuolar protein sorting-associated protein 45 [Malassezia sp. CBS 17886]|nr:vacuolar protein sorting-associated protein 45 [Malassezia sp. CBS 17886]
MDVGKAISAYMERMVQEVQGMKMLLLDEHTTPTISASMTQSALLEHEVYLTDMLENGTRDRMPHLQCIVYVRPCTASLEALCHFSNTVPKQYIERLAEADQHQLVQSVQEFFSDYVPVTSTHFTLQEQVPPHAVWGATATQWDADALQRHTDGLLAVLLSLKKRPVVRYERMSALAKRLAEDAVHHMSHTDAGLFDFRRTDVPPLLLILDRRNDPVTPLLTQWTYQAMVHELLGIHNGRTTVPGASAPADMVLSVDHDPFFAANLYDNFGDLGASIKEYVLQFQTRSASTSAIETVQDMKRFVEEYPEFQRLRGNVSKHVALLDGLSALVEQKQLLQVSELEQSLASSENQANDLRHVQALLASPAIDGDAKLRLAILYALRYQHTPGNQIDEVARLLLHAGIEPSRAVLLYVMLNFAGAEQRQDDLFANKDLFARGKSALKGLKGVENVYTRHSPHLLETVDQLMRGRLRVSSYPFANVDPNGVDGGAPATVHPGGALTRPQDVILFVIGGTTYEEARVVALLNGLAAPGARGAPSWPGTRFLLGGTTVHNSHSFLNMIQHTATRLPASITRPPPGRGGEDASGLQLRLGPVHLAVPHPGGAAASEGIGQVASGARDFATGLLGRLGGGG